jgi:hypothetical protein
LDENILKENLIDFILDFYNNYFSQKILPEVISLIDNWTLSNNENLASIESVNNYVYKIKFNNLLI